MSYSYDEQNIFAKILRGDIPNKTVLETEHALAFEDIAPQAPTHVLVIPKKKITGFSKVRHEDVEALGQYMKRISEVAEKLGLEEDGYRVVFNQGSDGGQTVEYIHAHIIGGRSLNWPPG